MVQEEGDPEASFTGIAESVNRPVAEHDRRY